MFPTLYKHSNTEIKSSQNVFFQLSILIIYLSFQMLDDLLLYYHQDFRKVLSNGILKQV